MVKTHNITGLKYLCITEKQNPITYLGSGKYWKRHLKTHGKDITTEILFETENVKEFKEKGNYYSELWNVVESDLWANFRPENGEGGDTVSCKCWITNGVIDKYHNKKEIVPEGWNKGRSNCVFNNKEKQRDFAIKARSNDKLEMINNPQKYNEKNKSKGEKIRNHKKGRPNLLLRKPIMIDRKKFDSILEACKNYNVGYDAIYRMLRNNRGYYI